MKTIPAAFTVILFFLIVSCQNKPIEPSQALIIPKPQFQETFNTHFVLDDYTGLSFSDEFQLSAHFLKSFIETGSGMTLKEGNEIVFTKDDNLKQEAYELDISETKIEIKASTDQGAFYAVQSLRQLMPVGLENGSFKENKINILAIKIIDNPRFKYRGMHLDVARHMFPVDFIKQYIDALAMLKFNTFHWHLTDDQGWRIEIKKFPKLQSIAAYRNETLIGHYSDNPQKFDGKKYGGYYTQEEVKEVVAYAKERFVTIIPEIEMPGHSQAVIAAYPELGCVSTGSTTTEEPVEVATRWGVFDQVLCPTEETFGFLEDVLDEVMLLFPSKYIHIGGDEAPKTKWEESDFCQQLIKENGLKDEHELQSYFINRIETYLNSKGREIIGWDEILEGGLAPNATVMSWRGKTGAVQAAQQHHDVVMTPTSHCYFDYYQSENENEPLAIGGFLPLQKVYSFDPIPEELTEEESQYIIGVQANVWTEYMPTAEQVEYMVFPRIMAMSEIAWSSPNERDFKEFAERVEYFNQRLDLFGVNYANHLYEISGQMTVENGKPFYELSTLIEGKPIRYTTDGSNPSMATKLYTEKIPITNNTALKAQVFRENNPKGQLFIQNIKVHKALGQQITINKEPHKAYVGSGAQGLVNGINGSNQRFGDKEWLGFWGEDIEVIIEFDEPTEINSITTRFYHGTGQWIYAPSEVSISMELPDVGTVLDEFNVVVKTNSKVITTVHEFPKGKPIIASQLKLIIPNYGTIPDGKQGAGNPAWTFIDEIVVE